MSSNYHRVRTALITNPQTVYAVTLPIILQAFLLVNTGAASCTVTVAIVPLGGVLGAPHYIVPGSTIAALDQTSYTPDLVLETGDSVIAYASATGVNLWLNFFRHVH